MKKTSVTQYAQTRVRELEAEIASDEAELSQARGTIPEIQARVEAGRREQAGLSLPHADPEALRELSAAEAYVSRLESQIRETATELAKFKEAAQAEQTQAECAQRLCELASQVQLSESASHKAKQRVTELTQRLAEANATAQALLEREATALASGDATPAGALEARHTVQVAEQALSQTQAAVADASESLAALRAQQHEVRSTHDWAALAYADMAEKVARLSYLPVLAVLDDARRRVGLGGVGIPDGLRTDFAQFMAERESKAELTEDVEEDSAD